MKKLFCIAALAAVSFGSVYAVVPTKTGTMKTDTTKKWKKGDTTWKAKKDTTKKM